MRPRVGFWWGSYYVSLVVLGYGVSLGYVKGFKRGTDWLPILLFRSAAYRGLR